MNLRATHGQGRQRASGQNGFVIWMGKESQDVHARSQETNIGNDRTSHAMFQF
jgi:hypothetical protein